MTPIVAALMLTLGWQSGSDPQWSRPEEPVARGPVRTVDRLPAALPYDTAGLAQAVERDIVRWTNVERIARGLHPVRWSPTLARAARQHTNEMVRLRYFSHTSPVAGNRGLLKRVRNAGLRAGAIFVGENLAWGNWTYRQAREIVAAWMDSPGHRENLLRRTFRYLGVGVRFDGRDLVATQVFGNAG